MHRDPFCEGRCGSIQQCGHIPESVALPSAASAIATRSSTATTTTDDDDDDNDHHHG